MSINIGAAGCEAIKMMRSGDQWPIFLAAIEDCARQKLHEALVSEPEFRVDMTAYARAIHDLFTAMTAATREQHARQVGKLTAKALADA